MIGASVNLIGGQDSGEFASVLSPLCQNMPFDYLASTICDFNGSKGYSSGDWKIRMDKESEIQLQEWKQRYESYRAYRGQYLTTLSICASGYIIGMSVAIGLNIPETARVFIFGAILVGLIVLGTAHVIALKAVNVLGERMVKLQGALGMGSFDSVWLLRTALGVSAVATGILAILTLVIALYFQFQGT